MYILELHTLWMVAGIFREEFSAVALGGGLYRGDTLQHWYFTALGIFSSQDIFQYFMNR